jgi:ABC-2 type transport system ATP-binding protein
MGLTALACLLAAAPAAARDAVVTSFDGTSIATSFFPAEGLAPGQRAPTVLVGHGWGGSRDTNPDSASDDLFGQVGLGPLRRAGFNVLSWDARGWGQSGGTVEVDSKDFEGRDVQALIDFIAKQPEARLDGPNDPRVGMSGVSYGGGIQLVAAALDKRIDAIAPTIAWHSLLTSLFPEGNIKFGWGSLLSALGVEGTLPGGLNSPATAAGRQDPHFYSIFVNGAATGTTTQSDLDWMAGHGPGDLVDRIHVPTLIMQGTVDTLFPLDEGVTNFQQIGDNAWRKKRSKRVPVKMIWFCGGHGACLTGAGPGSSYLDQRQLAWFDRYLRGKRDSNTGPKFAWIADDGQLRSSDAYPLQPVGRLTASGSGTLPILPGTASGGLILATPAVNAVNVPIPGPASPANVIGPPHLDLSYRGTALPQSTWVYAQFVNTRNGTVLGNIATPIPLTLDGQAHSISRDLEMVAGRAPAGGGYTLQLTASSSLYDIQRSAGLVSFGDVDVSMPLGDPVSGSKSAPRKRKRSN